MMIYLVLAFLLGMIFAVVVLTGIASGELTVFIPDNPNEQGCLGIDLGKYSYTIHEKKYILFRVKLEDLHSQK